MRSKAIFWLMAIVLVGVVGLLLLKQPLQGSSRVVARSATAACARCTRL